MDWLLLVALIMGLIVGIWRKSWLLTVVTAHCVLLVFGWLLFGAAGIVLALISFLAFWGALVMFALFLLPLRQWKREWRLATEALWGFTIGRTRPYYGLEKDILVERKKGRILNKRTGPGIIILTGNHAVALSEGTGFTRVDGPGLVFTHRRERPLQLVDLRPQIRPADVEATTLDGIRVKSRVFLACRVKGSDKRGGKNGEYPYNISEPDVFLAVRSAEVYPDHSESIEEVILNKAIALVRDEFATFRLDRLWGLDAQGKDPQSRLQDRVQSKLKEFADRRGVEVLGASLSPIEAPRTIIEQRIQSWQLAWAEKMLQARGESEADVVRAMGIARAQAQRAFILAILSGLDGNPNLSGDLIAYQFITALERAIQNPDVKPLVSAETERTVESLRRQIRPTS